MADTFVDHVRQSVPLYDAGHELVGRSATTSSATTASATRSARPPANSRSLAEHHAHKSGARFIGIDPVEAMVEKAREHCTGLSNVELIADDALTHNFEKADLFVSYYCVQFVQPRHRQDLINRIYERCTGAARS